MSDIPIEQFKSLNYTEIKKHAQQLSTVEDYIPRLFRTLEFSKYRKEYLNENPKFKEKLDKIKKKKRKEFKKTENKKEYLLKEGIDFINKYSEYTILVNLKKGGKWRK